MKKTVPDYALRLENVSKRFGHFVALKGITLDIKRGEIIGLIGGNGAGKTTLSEIITGLTKPTSGSVKYGFKYKKVPQEKIGMQFQESSFPSGLSIKNIIKFAIDIHKISISKQELMHLLNLFQIVEFYNKKPRQLSGGQRQKLNILLAILHKPELIILDEISTGLDISAREEIISFTRKLLNDNQITAIVISHHMAEIRQMCSKVVVLDHGTIKLEATVAEIEATISLDEYMRQLIVSQVREHQKSQSLDLKGVFK